MGARPLHFPIRYGLVAEEQATWRAVLLTKEAKPTSGVDKHVILCRRARCACPVKAMINTLVTS
jgi:hypothetical protein